MKSARILLSLALLVAVSVVTAGTASAAQMTNANDSLADPSAGAIGTTHTMTFIVNQGSNLGSIKFQFCQTPSGTCDKPAGLNLTNADLGSITNLSNTWTLDKAQAASGIIIAKADIASAMVAGSTVIMPLTTINNSAINDCQPGGDASTDTCYVRINTYTGLDGATTPVDEAIISYTVVAAVTVSARVDPTFTFVVAGVGASTGTNGITTSVASNYNTLPFSNLTAGTPKYAAHKLNVTTNTQGGYTVSMLMQSQMTGIYGANNIDPFTYNSATWAAPKAWTHPTGGTANTDTAWIGANTNDTRVSNWSGDTKGLFAPVNSTAATVMKNTTSDNGTNGVYVSYAIEANVFQPADTYTGTLVYNALPTY